VSDDIDNSDDDPVYAFKSSLIGPPNSFRLGREGLVWSTGRRAGTVRYDRIRRVRLSFRPVTMQSYRFITEIWSNDAPKIQIASTSSRSFIDQQRQDGEYRAFIGELHRRVVAAGGQTEFLTGMAMARFGLGVVVFAALLITFALLMIRTVQRGDMVAVAVICGVFALFGWQAGNYLKRNRPGTYRPDALPPDVIPKS